MAERAVQKPLVEQILDEMFSNLEQLEEFDREALERLKELAGSGNLRRTPQVIQALKSTSGGPE